MLRCGYGQVISGQDIFDSSIYLACFFHYFRVKSANCLREIDFQIPLGTVEDMCPIVCKNAELLTSE